MKLKSPETLRDWLLTIGAVSAAVVVVAGFITLPDRVEKVEASDAEQTKILERMTAVWEYQQQMQQQMPEEVPRPVFHEEQDRYGRFWCCDDYDGRDCRTRWYQC